VPAFLRGVSANGPGLDAAFTVAAGTLGSERIDDMPTPRWSTLYVRWLACGAAGGLVAVTPLATWLQIPGVPAPARRRPSASSRRYTPRVRTRARTYLEALAAVAAASAIAWPLFRFVDPGTLTTVYLLAVVVVAVRDGRSPAVVATLASVAAFDFFFVPPYFTFAVAEAQYLLTFGVMLAVGIVVGGLTARIRAQADASRRRERWTAALSAFSGAAASAGSTGDVARMAARHLAELAGTDVVVLVPDTAGTLTPVDGGAPFPVDERERRAVAAAFTEGRASGEASSLVLPLSGAAGRLGVVAVRPRSGRMAPDERRQLEAFVTHTALALERCRLAGEAQAARVRVEAERLRSSLLTSISHDLRTPLTAITGAATTLLGAGEGLDRGTQTELLEAVRDEADRLHRLVQNLLEMTRLESGALRVQREWHPIEEVVGAALRRLARAVEGRRVAVSIPADLPLVAIDDVLVEQVFVNLLDNAVKYTPPGSAIRIVVTAGERHVTVEVADHGPGLPRGEEERVFDKFHRAGTANRHGAGLGLAICRGIVHAHGGRIWAQNLPEGGVAFLFTLPLGEAPVTVPADA
jgi:two-component system, OmpR family, sensor histidine kinase KdpD